MSDNQEAMVDMADEESAWDDDETETASNSELEKDTESKVAEEQSEKKPESGEEKNEQSVKATDNEEKKIVSEARKKAETLAKEMEDEEDRKLVKEAAEMLRKKEPVKEEAGRDGGQETDTDVLLTELSGVAIKTLDEDGNEKKTTLGEFSKEYPEMAQIALAVGEALGKRIEERFEAVFGKVERHSEFIERLEYEKSRAALVASIEADTALGHPDASEIVYSEDFGKWFGEQDEALQKLGRIHDKRAAAVLLSAYKEDKGIKTVEKSSASDRKRKEVNDLHRSTMRTRAPRIGTSPKTQEEEEREAWENDDDD